MLTELCCMLTSFILHVEGGSTPHTRVIYLYCLLWFIANAQGKSVYRRDGKKSRCSDDIKLLCLLHVRQFDGTYKQENHRKNTTGRHQLNSDSSRHM